MPKYRVAILEDLDTGSLTRCDAGGTPVCVIRLATGEVFAVTDTCSHEEASLSEGFLDGSDLECPWHSSLFDVRTGAVLGPPATEPIATFQVHLEGEEVYVEL